MDSKIYGTYLFLSLETETVRTENMLSDSKSKDSWYV